MTLSGGVRINFLRFNNRSHDKQIKVLFRAVVDVVVSTIKHIKDNRKLITKKIVFLERVIGNVECFANDMMRPGSLGALIVSFSIAVVEKLPFQNECT